jgi:hypothetical protein
VVARLRTASRYGRDGPAVQMLRAWGFFMRRRLAITTIDHKILF